MAYTTINKGTDHFNTKNYSGNGSTNAITGVGFKPDFTWIKGRSGTYKTENHNVYDSTRGTTKFLIPNGTTANSTDANSLTAFGTDGFTLGTRGDVNGASTEYVSWNFKANGGTTSSNTDGSITSTVQANTTSGFSIVKYTGNATSGATVGHGLGAVPKMILVKNLDATENWSVYHNSIGNTKFLRLNQTNATTTSTTIWNDTTPTTSVFTVGNGASVNGSGNDFIAYCFAEKKGFSKFGTYTGAGAGAYIYTGFKPAYILVKAYNDASRHWVCWDNKRANEYNPQNERMIVSGAFEGYESDTRAIDFLSNGFKFRDNGTDSSAGNNSGTPYLYMAFAEAPIVGTNNVPANAR